MTFFSIYPTSYVSLYGPVGPFDKFTPRENPCKRSMTVLSLTLSQWTHELRVSMGQRWGGPRLRDTESTLDPYTCELYENSSDPFYGKTPFFFFSGFISPMRVPTGELWIGDELSNLFQSWDPSPSSPPVVWPTVGTKTFYFRIPLSNIPIWFYIGLLTLLTN